MQAADRVVQNLIAMATNAFIYLFLWFNTKSFIAGRMQCVTDARTIINCKLVRCPEEYIMTHFCILLDILFGDEQGGGDKRASHDAMPQDLSN